LQHLSDIEQRFTCHACGTSEAYLLLHLPMPLLLLGCSGLMGAAFRIMATLPLHFVSTNPACSS
jgi:hypothetical protein